MILRTDYAKVELPQDFYNFVFVENPSLRHQTAADINAVSWRLAGPARIESDQKISRLLDQLLVVMSRRRRLQRHNEFLAEEDFARVDVLYAPNDEGLQRCLHEFQLFVFVRKKQNQIFQALPNRE